MDFITGLPNSEGKSVIMVIFDRLTKCAHLYAPSKWLISKALISLFFIFGAGFIIDSQKNFYPGRMRPFLVNLNDIVLLKYVLNFWFMWGKTIYLAKEKLMWITWILNKILCWCIILFMMTLDFTCSLSMCLFVYMLMASWWVEANLISIKCQKEINILNCKQFFQNLEILCFDLILFTLNKCRMNKNL